jgi:malonyl-CoA O-methyltransferase
MISRKTAIKRQFDRSAAGSYDTHAQVQRGMANRLTASLKQRMAGMDVNGINILEIGCGTGTLTEMLVNEWPNASITAIDIAPAMLQVAEERISLSSTNDWDTKEHLSRVRFLLGDVEKWAADVPASSFDLIVSNACFQWFSHPSQTLEHLGRLLRVEGVLAFATFGPDTFHELHSSFDEAYRAVGMEPQRHGLSFHSADQWGELLSEAGFSDIRCEQHSRKEQHPSVRDFLLSVKAQGASTSEAVISARQVPRHLFTNMYKRYESKFSTPGGIIVTYDLQFILAQLRR